MTWTQGQPFRSNQPPFTDVDPQDNVQQPPVSRNYTRSNDHRPDHRQRQSSPRPNMRQQDVAATFTQEGLQTFSTIFSSAVEAAIAKSLPDIVERAIERKIRDVISNLQHEIDARTSDLGTVISGQIEAAMATHMERMLDELSTKLVNQNVKPYEDEILTVHSSSEKVVAGDQSPASGGSAVVGTARTLEAAGTSETVEAVRPVGTAGSAEGAGTSEPAGNAKAAGPVGTAGSAEAAGTSETAGSVVTAGTLEAAAPAGPADTAKFAETTGISREVTRHEPAEVVSQAALTEDIASTVTDDMTITQEKANFTESEMPGQTTNEVPEVADEPAEAKAEDDGADKLAQAVNEDEGSDELAEALDEDEDADELADALDEDGVLAIEEAEMLYQQTQRERRESATGASVASVRSSHHRGRIHEEGRIVIEALRELGRPVKTSELPNLIQDVHWGSNPSAKIKSFMDRSNGQIQRTGRGIYAYQTISH